MEFIVVIEVAVRYRKYTIYSVYSFNRDDADCIKRYKGKRESFLGGAKKMTSQPGRYLLSQSIGAPLELYIPEKMEERHSIESV